MAGNGVSVKLLIDKQSNQVLFAEGGKDFVDFLFHFFSLPVGAVVSLLTGQAMVGSLGNLYASFENLSNDYMQPMLNKEILLKPCSTSNCLGGNCPLQIAAAPAAPKSMKFYKCGNNNYNSYNCSSYVSNEYGAKCGYCGGIMTQEMIYVTPPGKAAPVVPSKNGYVQNLVTYMIMDDLIVKPMSTISSITLLNKFNVRDLTSLEEKDVQVGLDEGMALLKASLETKNVLTQVFLQKNSKKEAS